VTSLDRRSLSKVRRGERGQEYVERRLVASVSQPAGAASPARPTWPGRCWRPGWSLRHGGCYRYAFRLGRTRAERAAVRIALPSGPYPKGDRRHQLAGGDPTGRPYGSGLRDADAAVSGTSTLL